MIHLLLISLLVGFTVGNYCDSSLCPNGGKHIACGNSGNFASSCPADRKLVTLSNNDINNFLKQHNVLRNKIASGSQPGFSSAARMPTLVWSSELAKLAELNVKQCKMSHDKCRSTAVFKYAGQNLAYRANTGKVEAIESVIEKVVRDWYGEVKDAKQSDINKCCTPASGKTIGHFTQVVVDRATHVGCAIARYTDGKWKTTLVACNYSMTNIVGAKIYESGKAASGCMTGVNADYKALCSKNEQIKVK